MKQIWLLYLNLPWDKKVLWSSAVLSLIPIGLTLLISGPSSRAKVPPSEPASVDTFIPRGFVLVPIDVMNYEALDSILGKFGIVDLFAQTQKLVARNVRLLRAPHNPSHFAILVPERQAAEILKQGASFTVILKSSRDSGTEFERVSEKQVKSRSIIYGGE